VLWRFVSCQFVTLVELQVGEVLVVRLCHMRFNANDAVSKFGTCTKGKTSCAKRFELLVRNPSCSLAAPSFSYHVHVGWVLIPLMPRASVETFFLCLHVWNPQFTKHVSLIILSLIPLYLRFMLRLYFRSSFNYYYIVHVDDDCANCEFNYWYEKLALEDVFRRGRPR
jgi:hypothetical protein